MLSCSVYVVCRYGLQRAFHICLLADSRQLQCSRCSLLPTNYFGYLLYLVFHLIFGRNVHFAGVGKCAASGNSKCDGRTRCVKISGRRPRSSAERRCWPASKAGRHSAQVERADSCGLFSVFLYIHPKQSLDVEWIGRCGAVLCLMARLTSFIFCTRMHVHTAIFKDVYINHGLAWLFSFGCRNGSFSQHRGNHNRLLLFASQRSFVDFWSE